MPVARGCELLGMVYVTRHSKALPALHDALLPPLFIPSQPSHVPPSMASAYFWTLLPYTWLGPLQFNFQDPVQLSTLQQVFSDDSLFLPCRPSRGDALLTCSHATQLSYVQIVCVLSFSP